MVAWCVWRIVCADFVSPFTSSPTRPAYCATDVVKRRQSKKKKFQGRSPAAIKPSKGKVCRISGPSPEGPPGLIAKLAQAPPRTRVLPCTRRADRKPLRREAPVLICGIPPENEARQPPPRVVCLDVQGTLCQEGLAPKHLGRGQGDLKSSASVFLTPGMWPISNSRPRA